MGYSKKAIATGMQSVLDAERESKDFFKIIETVMDTKEFKKIWNSPQVPDVARLDFMKCTLKYIFKEKGRETEVDAAETNNKLSELDKKFEALNKLMNV
ncbi:MAG: hypothetical protein LBI45_07500 [Bacteroidales bacterium]|jgi:hypothetical protein|nr:hypothetical protein [Bacteroidales bacterium]